MEWIKARLSEPSTWRGLGLLLAAAGLIPPESVDVVVAAGVALAGLADVFRRESK